MIYRPLGSTGLKVSQLGFGAMRLPMTGGGSGKGGPVISGSGPDAVVDREKAVPLLRAAFDAGVNYVDTAVGYCNRDSQRAVGDALAGYPGGRGRGRERIVVSTKNPYYDEDEKKWWTNLTDSLERLRVQYIDIYNHHGVSWKDYVEKVEPRVGKWMRKALDQKLIRHVACSFHDNNDALRKLVDTGYPEVITLQYNMLDRQLEDGIAYAHDKGVGIVVMGPVAGGSLGVDSMVLGALTPATRRVPELALRFVLSNPAVSLALSGMETLDHVRENVAVASDATSLSPADRIAISEHLLQLRKLADLYCTGCAYCKPCPQGVDIAAAFAHYNLGRIYGLWEVARQRYADLMNKGAGADKCATCGECEDKCPQKLQVSKQLAEAHAALTK